MPKSHASIAGLVLLASCSGSASDGTTDNTLGIAASALLGPTVAVNRGSCTTGQVSDQVMTTFRDVVIPAVMSRGRAAVNSSAFKGCLKYLLVIGNADMPHEFVTTGWGPYCPPGNTGCGDNNNRDAHWTRLGADSLSLAQLSEFYARRAWIESHSPNNVSITCDPSANKPYANSVWTENRTADESFFIRDEDIVNAVNVQNTGTDRQRADTYGYLAAVFWHEVMHHHGYNHTNDETGNPEINQIPHTVGACLRDTIEEAADLGCGPCPNGAHPAPSAFNSQSCACVADPAVPTVPTATRNWMVTDAPTIAVDSFGEQVLRMSSDGSTYRLVDGLWQNEAVTSSEIHAGGYVLMRRGTDGSVSRRLLNGNWTSVGTADANSLIMDDIGTIYRRSATQIHMMRVGSTTWEPIGGSSGVLIAGGDHFFATDPSNGNVYRYSHASNAWSFAGGAGAWFTVDAFGTLYGLATNKLSIYRNQGASTWDGPIGGSADTIGASARFYAREPSNSSLWRRYPNGTWERVGSTCTYYAPGGTSVFCISQSGSQWRIDAFERD